MDIETKIKDFIKYAKEVCLQNLFLADNIKVDLKNQDNLFEAERIEKEVISKYENIYLLLEEETLLNIYKKDKKTTEFSFCGSSASIKWIHKIIIKDFKIEYKNYLSKNYIFITVLPRLCHK